MASIDKKGRVPFAIIGVLILVLASGSGVYLGLRQKAVYDATVIQKEENKAEWLISDEVHFLKYAFINVAMEMLEGPKVNPGPGNGTEKAFQDHIETLAKDRYPRCVHDFEIGVSINRTALFEKSARLATGSKEEGGCNEVGIPWSSRFAVNVNFTVEKDGLCLAKNVDIFGEVPGESIFKKSVAELFIKGVQAEGGVERTARYVMTVLLQKRLLEGWGGSPAKPNVDSVLTASEVRKALEVALRMEAISLTGKDPVTGRPVLGRMDPADTYLAELGETHFNASLVLAQSLTGLADQLIMKYYDYLGVAGEMDRLIDLLETVKDWVESIWDAITGEGDGGTTKENEAVVSWVNEIFDRSGVPEELYRHVGLLDVEEISIPPKTLTVENETGEEIRAEVNGTGMVRLGSYDVFESEDWHELFPQLDEVYHQSYDSLEEMLKGLMENLAGAYIEPLELLLDPSDELSPSSEIENAVLDVLSDNELLRESILKGGESYLTIHQNTLEAIAVWLETNAEKLYDRESIVDASIDDVANSLLIHYEDMPGFDLAARYRLREKIKDHIEDTCYEQVDCALADAMDQRVKGIADIVDDGMVVVSGRKEGWLVEKLVEVVRDGVDDIPSILDVVEEKVTHFGGDFAKTLNMSSGQLSFYIPEDAGTVTVPNWYGQKVKDTNVSIFLDPQNDDWLIEITPPNERDGNVHYCSPGVVSDQPFLNVWSVKISGELAFSVANGQGATHFSHSMNASMLTSVASLWPLLETEYDPGSTLLSDAMDFILTGGRRLAPFAETALECARKVADFLGISIIPWVMSRSGDLVNFLSNMTTVVVRGLQELLLSAASQLIFLLIEKLVSLLGNVVFSFSLFGLPITLNLLYNGTCGPVFRMQTAWNSHGAETNLALTLHKLPEGNFGMNYTVESDGANGWFSLQVDPLMTTMDQLLVLSGNLRGLGFAVEMPRPIQYETLSMGLQDIPGLGDVLSNIKIPNLGIQADVDAGFTIDYAPPKADNIVINEVESNPPGEDIGNEGIEIYNPLTYPVDLGGWTVETFHGRKELRVLDEVIRPGEVVWVTFDRQTIDNENEKVVLKNSAGSVIDGTPELTDVENDECTWQREFDGWGKWIFSPGSPGIPQGEGNFSQDFLASLSQYVRSVLSDAVDEMLETDEMNLDAFLENLKACVENFIDEVLALIEGIVRSVTLYIKLKVEDISGTGGVGYLLEASMSGQSASVLLGWVACNIFRVFGLFAERDDPEPFWTLSKRILTSLKISVSQMMTAEFPLSLAERVPSDVDIPDELQGMQTISFDIPLVGRLAEKDWGPWKVETGFRLTNVPLELAEVFIPLDNELPLDLWLVRATFYET